MVFDFKKGDFMTKDIWDARVYRFHQFYIEMDIKDRYLGAITPVGITFSKDCVKYSSTDEYELEARLDVAENIIDFTVKPKSDIDFRAINAQMVDVNIVDTFEDKYGEFETTVTYDTRRDGYTERNVFTIVSIVHDERKDIE